MAQACVPVGRGVISADSVYLSAISYRQEADASPAPTSCGEGSVDRHATERPYPHENQYHADHRGI